MDVTHFLQRFVPEFSYIAEAPLLLDNQNVGWECVYLTRDDKQLGGAVHTSRETCRQIGLAETLERKCVKEIDEKKYPQFLLSEYPSTCGFAFGYDDEGASARARNEALERWAWSKWIDEGYALPKVDAPSLNSLSRYLAQPFDQIHYFAREFKLNGMQRLLGIVVAEKNGGVFPGSRVTTVDDQPWEHALSEAFRHLQIYEIHKNQPRDLITKRIVYFGENGPAAWTQIEHATRLDWEVPNLRCDTRYNQLPEELFLYRALCASYLGWHAGDEMRFVY